MNAIPSLEHTKVEAISGIVNDVRATFHTQKTRPLEFRLRQLRKLYWGLIDNADAIAAACKQDLGKGKFETDLAELDFCTQTILFNCKHLEKWAKDETAPDIPLANKLLFPKIRKDPLGCVLIIGPYNFPVNLVICPLAGAIAAGNTVVIKPSENAPQTALLLQTILANYLDPTCYTTVQGAIPETTALLEQKWDKIFYTGGVSVGTIIAKKAAETLTPVTLELGGRNPAIITKNADIRLAARRLLWAKIANAGQVCISQNYSLVDKEVLSSFIAEMKTAMKEFYPNGTRNTSDFARIINNRQWQRLKRMLNESKGKILMGGEMDEDDRYIEPTIIQVDSSKDSLVAEESFGPFIPIMAVENLDEAIRIANEVDATPLGIYPFGNKSETERVLQEVRSGGATVNDGFMHGALPTLSFGGVGESGQGAYRGQASFECFTHRRSIVSTPSWLEGMMSSRYPPYDDSKMAKLRAGALKPNFDREGKVRFSLVSYVLSLGAGSKTGGLVRYLFVILTAIGFRRYLQ
ncbi:Hexadecenal dehydrogenase [Lecanora helva]